MRYRFDSVGHAVSILFDKGLIAGLKQLPSDMKVADVGKSNIVLPTPLC